DKTSGEIGAMSEQIKKALSDQFGARNFELRRIESVGPKVGEDLRFRGVMSVLAATVMMGVYIWLRFELRFGVGAVIALTHDILVLVALFFLGGAVIRPFAFALLVGFFSGVYSTIFIASPVILLWEKRTRK